MMAAMENIDSTYGEYFQNPDSYVSTHGTTHEQEKQTRLTFQQRMEEAAGRISGTTNRTTNIRTEQKNAVIKLLIAFPFSDWKKK